MSEQADIETALARAAAAYKNVRDSRSALKDENDRLREALLAAAPLVDACSRKLHISKKWSNDVRAQIDAAIAKEAGQSAADKWEEDIQ